MRDMMLEDLSGFGLTESGRVAVSEDASREAAESAEPEGRLPSRLDGLPRCRHGAPLHLIPPHDCAYADERGRLIPRAAAEADRVAGVGAKKAANAEWWAGRWNAVFHATMERLWRSR